MPKTKKTAHLYTNKDIECDFEYIIGDGNKVRGKGNKVVGKGNTVIGEYVTVVGYGNRCFVSNSHIQGHGNRVYGKYNTVEGEGCYSTGDYLTITTIAPNPLKGITGSFITVNGRIYLQLPLVRYTNDVENGGDTSSNVCAVCLERSSRVLVHPCEHLCLCKVCASEMYNEEASSPPQCPICRCKITHISEVYY